MAKAGRCSILDIAVNIAEDNMNIKSIITIFSLLIALSKEKIAVMNINAAMLVVLKDDALIIAWKLKNKIQVPAMLPILPAPALRSPA